MIRRRIRTVKNSRVLKEYISGLIPFLTSVYILVDRVSSPGPFVKCVIIKSSRDIVNASINPEAIPENISGKITLKKAYTGEAPKSSAASYVLLLNCFSFGITDKITYGILKEMWARRTVPKPNDTPATRNKSINEIPVTISALSIGILVTPIKKVRELFFIPEIPSAAKVPITVAISDDRRAITIVFVRAFMIPSFLKREEYHLRVNPPQRARDFEELNDNTIKVAIGAYNSININIT